MSYLPGSGIVRHLNTDLSPVALWLGDGDLTEQVGARTLTVHAGVEQYTMLSRYVRGFYFDGATTLKYAVSDATLQMDDAHSFEAIIVHRTLTAAQIYCALAGAGETLGTNYLYDHSVAADGTFSEFWENGAGVNVSTPVAVGLPAGRPFLLAVTRSAASAGLCTLKVYIDGKLMKTISGVAAAAKDPTPANNVQQLTVGADLGVSPMTGGMGSLKLFNYELSAAQVLAESDYIRG